MGLIRPRKERLAEEAEHPGQTKYRIFWKDDSGKKVVSEIFWAKDNAEAKLELDIFLRKNSLVNPDDSRTYFYGTAGGWICDRGNGMEEEFDDIGDSMRNDETVWEKIKYFFMPVVWRLSDLRYAFADFWFWFKHYDMRTNKSHQRFESWNLDSAMLDLLEFNIPIIISDKNGIPNEFCRMARAELHKADPNFNIDASFRKNPNPNDEETELAEKMWNDELKSMLLHVRLYRYYSDFGAGDSKDPAYAEIAREYKSTLPYKDGTDEELDYQKMGEMIQSEWDWIWEWWRKYGQSCWT